MLLYIIIYNNNVGCSRRRGKECMAINDKRHHININLAIELMT